MELVSPNKKIMTRKIKTVKEFLKTGAAQFDIILRRGKGEPVEFSVRSEGEDLKLAYTEMIYPEPGSEGLIKIVKRISDDEIFHTNDMVEAEGLGSCFILQFNEDLVHCTVLDAFGEVNKLTKEHEKRQVQINHIDFSVEGDTEGIEDGGEDLWPESDSAIDEW